VKFLCLTSKIEDPEFNMANRNESAAEGANASRSRSFSNADLDASNAMMTSMAECFTLQHSTLNIPHFDGKNMPLKDFLQDVHNGAVYVAPTSQGAYVKAVLGKLMGPARDSTYGKKFHTVNELTKHLKNRFAPGKTYPYYHHEIENIRMKRNESVGDFYDRLNILISGARVSLQDKYGDSAQEMLKPVYECALDAFLRGLPDEIARSVDTRDPKNLEEALQHAVRIETRMESGILPTREFQRSIFSRDASPGYHNSRVDSQNHQPNYQHSSRNYSNFSITGATEPRTRSPSPNAARHPTGILRRTGSPEPRAYARDAPGHPSFQQPYPMYQQPPFYAQNPYYYPPMPYPYFPPYGYPGSPNHAPLNTMGQRPVSPNPKPTTFGYRSTSPVPAVRPYDPNRTAGSGSWRQGGDSTSRSRSPSPHNNKQGEHLNSQVARRSDATTSHAITERQQTVRFSEPAGEYIRASQIENHH
jgi:hypothetical protein